MTVVKYQLKEKIDNYKNEYLETEIADVIIQTLVVADLLDVDINKSLLDKLRKLEERADMFWLVFYCNESLYLI